MQTINQITVNRRTFLQATACASLASCSSIYANPVLTPVVTPVVAAVTAPVAAPRPRWLSVGSTEPNAMRFLVGKMSRQDIYPPFLDFSQQYLEDVGAIFISSPYGGAILSDVVSLSRLNNLMVTALIDASGCATQGLTDIAHSFDQQIIANDYEDFKWICGYYKNTPPALSIGTGNGYGTKASENALDTAITLAGFDRVTHLSDVSGLLLTVAANKRTLKLHAIKAIHRELRTRTSKVSYTLMTLTHDDHMVDGAFRVTVLASV
jgi:hypothetical protein